MYRKRLLIILSLTTQPMYVIHPIILLSDLTDHYPIACCVTRGPNRTKLKITQDNHYYFRNTRQFNCNWFKMYLQETIEAFLNTNELASSDQIDLYLTILYLLLVIASIDMLHLNVLQEKSAS